MPTSRVPVSWPCATGLVVASGALYGLCFAPGPEPVGRALAWVAPGLLFLALRDRGPGAAAALGALWAGFATACVIHWIVPTLREHFGWSLAASLGFLAGLSLASAAPFFAFAFGLTRLGATARRLSPGLFAAAFVAAELLRGQLGLRSPWAPLGATQVDAERIRQLADLAGVYGVTALVAGVSAAAAALLAEFSRAHRPPPRALAPALGAGIALLLAVGYGDLRLRDYEGAVSQGEGLEVALVQGNLRSDLRWKRSEASRVLRHYGALTRRALSRGDPDAAARPAPALVVWPENAVQTPVDDPVYGRPLLALARMAPLLLGAPRHQRGPDGRRTFNSAYLIGSDGPLDSYDKRRLLPFSESKPLGDWLSLGDRGDLDAGRWAAGHRPGVFALEGRLLGVLICLEALHPELAREAVREGADLLVNLSNDAWFASAGARRQHFAQIVFRAVETRRPLLRATPTGITAVVSATGAVEATLPESEPGVLYARVSRPLEKPPLYAKIGDVFAFACLLACAVPPLRSGLGGARRRLAHTSGPPGPDADS